MNKKYLSQAFLLNERIKAKEVEIEALRDMQNSVGRVILGDKVKSSGRHDRMAHITGKLLDLIGEYESAVMNLLFLKSEIRRFIETVDDVACRLILKERYVHLKAWEDIALDNHFSIQRVYQLHNKGLGLLGGIAV